MMTSSSQFAALTTKKQEGCACVSFLILRTQLLEYNELTLTRVILNVTPEGRSGLFRVLRLPRARQLRLRGSIAVVGFVIGRSLQRSTK